MRISVYNYICRCFVNRATHCMFSAGTVPITKTPVVVIAFNARTTRGIFSFPAPDPFVHRRIYSRLGPTRMGLILNIKFCRLSLYTVATSVMFEQIFGGKEIFFPSIISFGIRWERDDITGWVQVYGSAGTGRRCTDALTAERTWRRTSEIASRSAAAAPCTVFSRVFYDSTS